METIASRDLKILDWGLLGYSEALKRQNALREARISGAIPDHLVIVEHPPVVSLGRRGSLRDLRLSEEALHRKDIELYKIDRGGMATYHGPGQLVAYPILKLRKKDLHEFIRQLIETIADVLRSYGLRPEFKKGVPGVWVRSAKIASIGIAVRKWVTYHGLALNVNTDMEGFNLIIPCGHPEEKMTSMSLELGTPVDIFEVKKHLIDSFSRLFGFTRRCAGWNKESKHPAWLIGRHSSSIAIDRMEEKLRQMKLATVCENANCPNLAECFERGTATFMILGTRCTRGCRFCAVIRGATQEVDPDEPKRVALSAKALGLKYVVVTSVTRDDLPDGGAGHFACTIDSIRRYCPDARVEVLIPDFKGSLKALHKVFNACPDVLNHNIETVPRLYPHVRPKAEYRRSLSILEYGTRQGLCVKSGLMLGLGETEQEIMEAITDLKRIGCHNLTIGQYLAPSKDHTPVVRYVPPEEFNQWAQTVRSMGFKGVAAGPLVRSSYRADEMFAS